MKKIYESVLILTLLICLVGCSTSSSLRRAAYKGDIDTVTEMIDKGADVNSVFNGSTALTRAAVGEHRDVAGLLIDRGADIDVALAGCLRFSEPYQTRCIKSLREFKAARNQLQPAKSAVAPSQEVSPISKSDVDRLPAIKANLNKNAYAIVIGIEQYRQKLPKADFAVSDAKLVGEYLTKVMGYPKENVVTLTNDHATYVDLVKYFEKWLPNNIERKSSLFIYFSGHGAPDPKNGGAYLVPYDGDPSFIAETGYSLKRMYDALGKLPARKIVVALDSCFSGAGGRSVLAEGARPLVMNLQKSFVVPKNMTVLAAASGEQISSTYKEKGHGLFTYFLLKGIKNENVVRKDGSLAISDLFTYVKPQVERIARKQFNNEQTPQLWMGKQKPGEEK